MKETNEDTQQKTEIRFLEELRRHLKGWLMKVSTDLSEDGFEAELLKLRSDSVYSSFGLDSNEYALIRLMGRMSISIGRRLGEIYDKLPRFITQARFDLDAAEVAPKIGGNLELDVCIPLDKLELKDRKIVEIAITQHVKSSNFGKGPAIEIRYNFNPNDSSRLRKDVRMAELLLEEGFLPIYLIFSTISPREEAIARLTRAGWTFLVGQQASFFMNDLIGMDFGSILEKDSVKDEIRHEMSIIMSEVYSSYAIRKTLKKYDIA